MFSWSTIQEHLIKKIKEVHKQKPTHFKCWDCDKTIPIEDETTEEQIQQYPRGIDGCLYVICENCVNKEEYNC